MKTIRYPAVAGLFYPSDAEVLKDEICFFLNQIINSSHNNLPKALIVPHAGYKYSGSVAGSAYSLLAKFPKKITSVILAGPSHRVRFDGIAIPDYLSYATPLGTIPIDHEKIQTILSSSQVIRFNEAHDQEHCIEVQLPFLQSVLGQFSLIPLVVGHTESNRVSDVLNALWNGPETLIIISSDLSHYHEYKTAVFMDQATSVAIENLQPELITKEQACGFIPLAGLLHSAKKRGMSAKTLNLRNSGDTTGEKNSVVGYGAYAFF